MLEIRDAVPEDFDQVYTLLQQLWGDDAPEREDMKRDFMDYIESDRDFCFCGEDDGQITGFCSADMRKSMHFPGEMLYIDGLVVRSGFKKTGVGEKLLERAEALAREMDCRAIQIDVVFHLKGAQEFYKEKGFRQIGLLFGKPI